MLELAREEGTEVVLQVNGKVRRWKRIAGMFLKRQRGGTDKSPFTVSVRGANDRVNAAFIGMGKMAGRTSISQCAKGMGRSGRAKAAVPFGTLKAELESLRFGDDRIQTFIAGKQIVKSSRTR
jgi:hypothetical protein